MKELAVVKLTKSLLGKVGKKIAKKKEQWREEAALSVEETKRREAEFKADFAGVQKKLEPEVVKKEVQKRVEATTKVVQKVEESVKGAVAKVSAKEVAPKVSEAKIDTAEKKAEKEPENKEAASKTTKSPATKKAAKKSTTKTTASKKETKTANKAEATKKETAKKKPTKKATSSAKKATPAAKAPSKKEAKLALYSADIIKHYGKVDEEFLAIVVKNLGPSIYRKDAELVSCSDPKELDTVRKNFLIKKLQMQESDEVLNAAIKEVCEALKASRNKYRATFYYALAKKFKLESKLS